MQLSVFSILNNSLAYVFATPIGGYPATAGAVMGRESLASDSQSLGNTRIIICRGAYRPPTGGVVGGRSSRAASSAARRSKQARCRR